LSKLKKTHAEIGNLADYLTVSKAATFLGVSPATLRNWDRAAKLKPVRHPVNRYRLYRRSDLEELLDRVRMQRRA
jgi:DNA-binding transcriptional MerR regulator